MSSSSLIDLANQHRRAIIERDLQLASQIDSHYNNIKARILARLERLTKQIADARAAGDDVKISWLYEQRRMQLFLEQVQQEIQMFADFAQRGVVNNMHFAATSGASDAIALLDHQLGDVVGSFNRLPFEAVRQAVANVETDAHLAKLFGSFDDQAVDLVKKRLILAVALGENPRSIASDIEAALNISRNRALTIARTETINAYRDTAVESYRQNADVVSGWIWSAASGACPICRDLDGSHHPLSEDMDGAHPNCRCAALPDTVSYDDILAGLVA